MKESIEAVKLPPMSTEKQPCGMSSTEKDILVISIIGYYEILYTHFRDITITYTMVSTLNT